MADFLKLQSGDYLLLADGTSKLVLVSIELHINVFDSVDVAEDITVTVEEAETTALSIDVADTVAAEENISFSYLSIVSINDTLLVGEDVAVELFQENLEVSVYDAVSVVTLHGFDELTIYTAPGITGAVNAGTTRNSRMPYATAGVLGQNQVRVQFAAPYVDLTITKVTIGIRSSIDDFASAPTIVTFNGGSGSIEITGETKEWSDWIDFAFASPSDIIIHVYVDHEHDASTWTNDNGTWYYSAETADQSETLSVAYSSASDRRYVYSIETQVAPVSDVDVSVYDTCSVAEDVSGILSSVILSSVSSVSITESVTIQFGEYFISVVDEVSVTEDVSVGLVVDLGISVTDSVSITEELVFSFVSTEIGRAHV